jgi:hypothetical protein
MKEEIAELIKAERQHDGFRFIAEVIQKGRIRPSTYVHEIIIPDYLYEDLMDKGIINHHDNYTKNQAFYEFRHGRVIVSFMHLWACEDMHHRIDHFLIVKFTGSYPITRKGISKMNFDKL